MIFKKYPIRVLIFRKYGNVVKPIFDRAYYEKRRIKTVDGIIEREYLVLKKQKKKIPAVPITYYFDIENERWVYLYQIDRDTFWPCTPTGNSIYVHVPVYETDEKGNIKKNEKGEPIVKWVKKPLFSGEFVLDGGKAINIETLLPHRTYDKEEWLSSEIETAQRLFRSKSWWERYGNYVILGIFLLFAVMIMYVGFTKYLELSRIVMNGLKDVSNAINSASDKFLQASRILAQEKAKIIVNATTKPPY